MNKMNVGHLMTMATPWRGLYNPLINANVNSVIDQPTNL
jgi:hypothetical protein